MLNLRMIPRPKLNRDFSGLDTRFGVTSKYTQALRRSVAIPLKLSAYSNPDYVGRFIFLLRRPIERSFLLLLPTHLPTKGALNQCHP